MGPPPIGSYVRPKPAACSRSSFRLMLRLRRRGGDMEQQQTPPPQPAAYPLEFDVEYPDRALNRLTSAFRVFTVIPIMIVLASIGGSTEVATRAHTTSVAVGGSGLLVL